MAHGTAVVAQLSPTLGDALPSLVRGGWFLAGFAVVFVLGWFVVEPILARAVRRRNRNNPTLTEAVTRYVRLLVVVLAVAVGTAAAGFGGVLSGSALVVAAATLAVGVAGQTVVGSLVSGVVLVADPEFNVGNYVEWSDGEGEVESITLRVTRVHTPDGKLVTVPNTTLTSEAVTRPYGRGRTRVVEHVGVAYGDDAGTALDCLRDAAGAVDGVLDRPGPEAYVDEFGRDAVVVRVHYWIEDPRQRNVFGIRSAFARAAMDRLDAAGVTVSPASRHDLRGEVTVAGDDLPA
jgi:small-conductance mechanosensitive channel